MNIGTLINDFTKTDDFTELEMYPKSVVIDSIEGFYQVLIEEHGSDSSKWTGQQIYDVFSQLLMMSYADQDPDGELLASLIYDANRYFFEYLAAQGKLQLTADEMSELLFRFEEENLDLLVPEANVPPLGSEPVFNKPGLPEWREYVARDINNYVAQWLEAYFESPEWQRKQHQVDQDILELVVTTLAEKIYDYHRKTPKTWTKKALRDVMCTYLVGNVDLSDDDYQNLVPEVSEFLDYIVKRGWLNDKKAANYQRYMAAIEPDMIDFAQDETNFGPSKTIALEMRRQGIDINDRPAVDKFIKDLNARGGVDALYDDKFNEYLDEDDDPLDGDDFLAMLDNPQQLAEVAQLYDPDSQQQFLKNDHLPELDGHKWRKKTAIEVHQKAVQFGLRLWLTKKDAALENKMDAATTVGLVCEFVDVMYAQNLQKPSEWTAAAWYEFGDWLHKYSKEDNRGIRQANMLAELARVLGEADIISAKKAQQLAAAILGKTVVKNQAPTKVTGGKVISMKQARKLLKNRRR
ncbi:hypothetical protein HC026_00045 [Lactobacillus sp. LC28-10]|uniref:Uncharacterized protein n=1 Tax=Secundilactobacillus angelensis TaxID=2722706 RepID=A0ABX1KZ14_9LACO|nr:hypothetical protein [Secundilactobacillus angelensis]MCH5461813.1 hypothetical protein [Secundilactobacillus angelensis]NLR17301.1 hypothetical protein [Secundilactobacillus angelensis]